MSDNYSDNDSPASTLKSESARQRWEMFHRAIAHAKQCNLDALQESETPVVINSPQSGPFLTVVK